MNFIKILQNSQALSVSVVKYQFIHNFLDNFHQDGKYTAKIPSHQADLRREGNITDQKLFIYYISID